MNTQKISISIPKHQYDFIDNYQASHHLKTRSDVIRKALQLLELSQLEACYRDANNELGSDFDATSGDGLDNETW